MTASTVDVETSPDGTLVIQPHGALDADDAVELRRTPGPRGCATCARSG